MHTYDTSQTTFVPPAAKSDVRPFQLPSSQSATFAEHSPETADADIQARLDHASHFGHDLTRLQQLGDVTLQRQVESDMEQEEEEKTLIQAKLTIGQPGDKYEQEADAMAAKVMAMPDPRGSVATRNFASEENIQTKAALQRQAIPEEEEETTLQAKPQIQAKGHAPAVPANFESQLAQHKGGGRPLADETRAFMEPRFGADFSNVRVHETPDLANAIQAQAFTHGQDIYFNAGKYNPRSSGGKELLAHELTHVMQQEDPVGFDCISRKGNDGMTFSYWLNKTKKGQNFLRSKKDISSLNDGYRLYLHQYENPNGWKKVEDRNEISWESPAKNFKWHIYKDGKYISKGTINTITAVLRTLGGGQVVNNPAKPASFETFNIQVKYSPDYSNFSKNVAKSSQIRRRMISRSNPEYSVTVIDRRPDLRNIHRELTKGRAPKGTTYTLETTMIRDENRYVLLVRFALIPISIEAEEVSTDALDDIRKKELKRLKMKHSDLVNITQKKIIEKHGFVDSHNVTLGATLSLYCNNLIRLSRGEEVMVPNEVSQEFGYNVASQAQKDWFSLVAPGSSPALRHWTVSG